MSLSPYARPPRPLVMGLDIGSVSAKGVIIDAEARVIREDYRLSRSQSLRAGQEVTRALTEGGLSPDVIAVTGSGRYLIGKLLDADLIVNEITAQAAAAMDFDPTADTVVEIGGQDSKWIAFEEGHVRDFEMNRVCAAGTGSFLMAQAERLGLRMGREFSDAAFASARLPIWETAARCSWNRTSFITKTTARPLTISPRAYVSALCTITWNGWQTTRLSEKGAVPRWSRSESCCTVRVRAMHRPRISLFRRSIAFPVLLGLP